MAENRPDINEYVLALKSSPRMGNQVVYHTLLPARSAVCRNPDKPWPQAMEKLLDAAGIGALYSHQSLAMDRVRSGRHVVVATPTASGKTLIYNLPVLERILKDPDAKALYLFPLKALAQDQLKAFEALSGCTTDFQPSAAIYDGDTTAWRRKRIRSNPPNVLITNPDMLHLSLLPHHRSWASLFADLEVVVVDEVHTYRGVMGSHMAQVFRRLRRICAYYGVSPAFVFSSATVANPGELATRLTGLEDGRNIETVVESGAPQGRKHLVFVDPVQGPARTAILLLKAALHRGLRTIVYAQSRKLTELIALWAGSRSGVFKDRISAYRAGFLPEERREIERRLSDGDLLAVISTSALELGIDIGDLDLCLLVGYPGTIVSTRQRGGRVGRNGQDSAVVLIGGEDALDQYFMRHPQELISREPESAVVNPVNTHILQRHLVCAAAEMPLKAGEPLLAPEPVRETVTELERKGELLRSADGREIYARRKRPHRDVDLRGAGDRYQIVSAEDGVHRGEIDGIRAFREAHPGAIYLHNGITYRVDTLDLSTRTVKVSPARVDYYTRVRGRKDTEILDVFDKKTVGAARFYTGRLKVTDQVTGYEKWRIHGRRKINILPLDLPPVIFETEGLWFRIPAEIQRRAESEYHHFMGGIHAVEHAAIGICPLLVMADRNDLGGISTPFHPRVGGPAVFVYDGVPGGAGLSRQAFQKAESLLEATLKTVLECTCEFGCPSCVHSPKCGSGNRPIDKASAAFLLTLLHSPESSRPGETSTPALPDFTPASPDPLRIGTPTHPFPSEPKGPPPPEDFHFGVLDIETRRSAEEVGGWHRADLMGISCVVLYDSRDDYCFEFHQDEVDALIKRLQQLHLVVGFNIKRFDYRVLSGHSDFNFAGLPTLDMLEEVQKCLGFRLSLDHLAQNTLGAKKSADGLQALKWWKEGRIREIIDYCRTDVEITRDIFLYGKKNGYLLFKNKAGQMVRVPVDWGSSPDIWG
ncbi:MAG: DEAD/DEAH box helicase [Thermodesulfobacteriota bacterium]